MNVKAKALCQRALLCTVDGVLLLLAGGRLCARRFLYSDTGGVT